MNINLIHAKQKRDDLYLLTLKMKKALLLEFFHIDYSIQVIDIISQSNMLKLLKMGILLRHYPEFVKIEMLSFLVKCKSSYTNLIQIILNSLLIFSIVVNQIHDVFFKKQHLVLQLF